MADIGASVLARLRNKAKETGRSSEKDLCKPRSRVYHRAVRPDAFFLRRRCYAEEMDGVLQESQHRKQL